MKKIIYIIVSVFLLLAPLSLVLAQVSIDNPLEAGSFRELIQIIIEFIMDIAFILAPLFILIGAFYFLTAAGDTQKVKTGKNIIIYTLVGLLVIVASSGLIALVIGEIGVKNGLVEEEPFDLPAFLNRIVDWATYIVITAAVMSVMYAGYLFLTAFGESEKLNTAKKHLLYALLGAVIALSTRVIIQFAIDFVLGTGGNGENGNGENGTTTASIESINLLASFFKKNDF